MPAHKPNPLRDEEEWSGGGGGGGGYTPQDAPPGQPVVPQDDDPCSKLPTTQQALQDARPALIMLLGEMVRAFLAYYPTNYGGPGSSVDLNFAGHRDEPFYAVALAHFVRSLTDRGWSVKVGGDAYLTITHPDGK